MHTSGALFRGRVRQRGRVRRGGHPEEIERKAAERNFPECEHAPERLGWEVDLLGAEAAGL